jgi:hypothetical protein
LGTLRITAEKDRDKCYEQHLNKTLRKNREEPGVVVHVYNQGRPKLYEILAKERERERERRGRGKTGMEGGREGGREEGK